MVYDKNYATKLISNTLIYSTRMVKWWCDQMIIKTRETRRKKTNVGNAWVTTCHRSSFILHKLLSRCILQQYPLLFKIIWIQYMIHEFILKDKFKKLFTLILSFGNLIIFYYINMIRLLIQAIYVLRDTNTNTYMYIKERFRNQTWPRNNCSRQK